MPYDPAADPFKHHSHGPSQFGRKSRAVTPSDTTDLDPYCRILVTAAGTLTVIPTDNADAAPISLGTVAAGFIPPFEVRRVMLTGTTATVVTIE